MVQSLCKVGLSKNLPVIVKVLWDSHVHVSGINGDNMPRDENNDEAIPMESTSWKFLRSSYSPAESWLHQPQRFDSPHKLPRFKQRCLYFPGRVHLGVCPYLLSLIRVLSISIFQRSDDRSTVHGLYSSPSNNIPI